MGDYNYKKMISDLTSALEILESVNPDSELTNSIKEVTIDFARVLGALEGKENPPLAMLLVILATNVFNNCLKDYDFDGCEKVIRMTRERMVRLGYQYNDNGEPL